MVTASFGLGVLLGGLVLAFIAVRSGLLILIIPGILAVLWFATTTEIRMVTVEGNEREYAMFLALPFGEAAYTYEEREYPIPTDCETAVVNLTTDHNIELYRRGMELLFGLISISREHVMLEPGEVVGIDGEIKSEKKARATYFTLKVHPILDEESMSSRDSPQANP